MLVIFRSKSPADFPGDSDLERTTHLAIGAHPDDNELMAHNGISECYRSPGLNFIGVVITDGGGGTRGAAYEGMSDEELATVRRAELIKAGNLGGFLALTTLEYSSDDLKHARMREVQSGLVSILHKARPRVVYIHNLLDDHDTHVAAAVVSIAALRELREVFVPEHVYGCEVSGSLDWFPGKVRLDDSQYPDLARRILNIFESQTENGRSYPEAALARRRANAVFDRDNKKGPRAITYAMELRQLVQDPGIPIDDFADAQISSYRSKKLHEIRRFLV